jgi:predicted site-specific integrase-resolvase
MPKVSYLDRLLNEKEAAEILGISVKTARRWRWAGKGPIFRRIGACVRYHPADLEAFRGDDPGSASRG